MCVHINIHAHYMYIFYMLPKAIPLPSSLSAAEASQKVKHPRAKVSLNC